MMSEITGIISLRLRLTSPASAPFFRPIFPRCGKWGAGKEVREQRAEVRKTEQPNSLCARRAQLQNSRAAGWGTLWQTGEKDMGGAKWAW